MKRGRKVLIALVAVLMMLAAIAPAAFAAETKVEKPQECKSFMLLAAHAINGERLGLEDSALPVDVYVNGDYAFTFEFGDTVKAELPAGEYEITVNLAGTDTEVMSLGPVEIPGCVKARVVAKLVDGSPTLLAKIRELPTGK
jgi:hypothetical protein